MVQRITQAPPPRLTIPAYFRARNGPFFPLRFELFTFESLAFAAAALGSFLLASALLALPAAAPAFLGFAASGSAADSATSLDSVGWVGVGSTGSGSCNGSCRTCASSSLWKVTPSARRPAPDGSVVTTPSGSPSSFQASAASSSSLSLSPVSPAMIASAIRPAFWRTAASILLAMSGFSFRNCLAFSRPWPMRWLS